MNEQHHSISVIFPVYNEEDNIRQTIEGSIDFLKHQDVFHEYEIIIVDDGSSDGTSGILKNLALDIECLKIITHPRNLGYGRALVSGVKKALFSLILMMDADGQFKLSSLKDVVGYIPDYDIITGCRDKREDPWHRIFLGEVYTFLVWLLFGIKLRDVNCGFKLFKKEALDLNGTNCHAGVFYTNIFLKAKAKGCRIKEIPIEHFSRMKGRQTGASLKVVFESVVDIIRLKFFDRQQIPQTAMTEANLDREKEVVG